jgi:hypothetical protein
MAEEYIRQGSCGPQRNRWEGVVGGAPLHGQHSPSKTERKLFDLRLDELDNRDIHMAFFENMRNVGADV